MIILALAALAMYGQGPQFEVASVRRSSPDTSGPMYCNGGPGTSSPLRFSCGGMALAGLIQTAYDLQFFQMEGLPDWANWGLSNGYDVNANIARKATKAEFRSMLQTLLRERFGLQGRMEKLTRPSWVLVSGSKPKLMPSEPDSTPSLQSPFQNGTMRLKMQHQSMSVLASYLTGVVRGPVTDSTGIEGAFDFTLEFAPDFLPTADSTAPVLSSALEQQLGLRLVRRTALVDVFVVSHVGRDPGPN